MGAAMIYQQPICTGVRDLSPTTVRARRQYEPDSTSTMATTGKGKRVVDTYTFPDTLHDREGSICSGVERKPIKRLRSHVRGVLLKRRSDTIVDLFSSCGATKQVRVEAVARAGG